MSRRQGWAALVIAFVALALGVGLAATRLAAQLARPQVEPPVQVPARWKQVKGSVGHRAHLAAGDVKCRDCHLFDANGFVAPGTRPCSTCHAEKQAFVHGSALARAATDCFSCHDFGGDPGIKPWACARCHAPAAGAKVTHFDQDCAHCHRPHDQPSLLPRACRDCHQDVGGATGVRHGARLVAGASTCLDCHEAHDQSIQASRRCQSCHVVQAKQGQHEQCITCHEPHRFGKREVRTCTSCHGQKRLLGPHRDCKTCHDPHDASPAAAAARCQSCHAKQKMAHPNDGKTTDCLGCHPAHPDDEQLAQLGPKSALACTSCHPQAPSDTLAHAGNVPCRTCHAPHGPGAAFVQKGVSSCGRCHASEMSKTFARTGHRDCNGCHVKANHDPKHAPLPCATCHIAEAATASTGHAKACATCHDPHDGRRTPAAACMKCHPERGAADQPHAKLANGCASCHRPHGPGGVARPPECLDCHSRAALPNLHQVAGHAKCVDCHGAHLAEPRRDRESCLRCHAAQRAHEPGAPVCSGCHPFGGRAGAVPGVTGK
jgi:hypothetical protein